MHKNKSGYNPLAPEFNSIIFGNARFQFFTDKMFRLEWNGNGDFEDQCTLAVVNRSFPKVEFRQRADGKKLYLKTGALDIQYTDNGECFSRENLLITFDLNGEKVLWNPGLENKANLGATIRTLDGVNGNKKDVKGIRNPDYIKNDKGRNTYGKPGQSETEFIKAKREVDLGNGLLSRDGWALVDDSENIVIGENSRWVEERPEGKRQDLYFMAYGHDYKRALADSAEVFGRQPLPPKYTFGYWWSRYWAYTDEEIEELVDLFDAMKVPIDVMVVDMDWHLEGWTGYTWDRRYFPDPAEFLSELKRRNMKITLNLHPADGVAEYEDQFEDMADAMGLDKKKIDKVEFEITDQEYMNNYFKLLHHPDEKRGVDFWWMDWQQGKSTAIKGLDTLPWINHLHWEDMVNNPDRGDKRPLIFSRFGGIGAGRYCIGFSGDTYSNWDSLAFQPYFTSTASNVLYGYWSHDIGGHMPGKIEPELYTRWMQYGMYSPVLRTHTTKNPAAERRVWEYPDPYNKIMMDVIRQRYELVPYIYTESRKAFDNGVSLCRPMYYDYPECDEAYKAKNQYMFGDKMLIAPVIEKIKSNDEMAEVSIWLPEGKWFDTARGSFEEGGQVIFRKYMLDEIPVFVRPGTVIPGQIDAMRLDDKSIKNLMYCIYDGDEGEYTLYEDDGISSAYETGNYAEIKLVYKNIDGIKKIIMSEVSGEYEGFEKNKSLEFRIAGTVPPAEVKIGGKTLKQSFRSASDTWRYDGKKAEIIISLSERDISRGFELDIITNEKCDNSLADGLKGVMNRLKRINYYNTLSTSYQIIHEDERLGVEMAQAGNRISRNPQNFENEVNAVMIAIDSLEKMLTALSEGKGEWEDNDSTGPESRRFSYCRKALAILKEVKK